MKNLLKTVDIKSKLNSKYIVLFLDFDGTLSPIVEKHSQASLPVETKNILFGLSKNERCKLAIISGRELKDVEKRVNIKGIIYAGEHGLKIEGPEIKFSKTVPGKYRNALKNIRRDLAKKFLSVKGVFLEYKGLSLTVHYRMVEPKKVQLVKDVFFQTVNPYLSKSGMQIKKGKKLLEIRPVIDWDKGKAVLRLLSIQKKLLKSDKILPIYIGDDITDEDAFRVLKNKGITVFVGRPKKSHARFYLKNPKEVKNFLIIIGKLLETEQK